MKQNKLMLLMAGFLAGMMYVVACGTTGQSLAAAIGNAIDVVFDNTTSGLTATTVQGAIDEVNTRVETLESDVGTSSLLAGTWTGTQYEDSGPPTEGVTLVLNADGTYTCSGSQYYCDSSSNNSTGSWEVIGDRILHLSSPDSLYRYFSIVSVSSTSLTLNPIGASIFIQLVK